jgi:hypothetical protein
LKLSPTLAQFLYSNKRLQLTGIGRFLLDSTTDNEIKFEQDASVKEDPDLIAFISAETGKMKSLAAADLDSHLELARQFINIGKPFLFEGIGTLVKVKSGRFDFTPGPTQSEKVKESTQGVDPTSTTEESFTQYEDMFSRKKTLTLAPRKIAVMLAVLAGIGLAVWGGYTVYQKGASIRKNKAQKEQVTVPVADTARKQDSVVNRQPDRLAGTYRFVIEHSPKKRALKRYTDLRSYGVNVKMETPDSVMFKLVMVLPATTADTLRIRDSLGLLYGNARYMKNGKGWVE